MDTSAGTAGEASRYRRNGSNSGLGAAGGVGSYHNPTAAVRYYGVNPGRGGGEEMQSSQLQNQQPQGFPFHQHHRPGPGPPPPMVRPLSPPSPGFMINTAADPDLPIQQRQRMLPPPVSPLDESSIKRQTTRGAAYPPPGALARSNSDALARSNSGLARKRTLVRPERRRSYEPARRGTISREPSGASVPRKDLFNSLGRDQGKKKPRDDGPEVNTWVMITRAITCCIPWRKSKDPYIQQAFREKLALCIIIFFLMLIVGFITFGFQSAVCVQTQTIDYIGFGKYGGMVAIHGGAWLLSSAKPHSDAYGQAVSSIVFASAGTDLSAMFPPLPNSTSSCQSLKTVPKFACTAFASNGTQVWPNKNIIANMKGNPLGDNVGCHWSSAKTDFTQNANFQGILVAGWDVVSKNPNYVVYNSQVLDMSRLLSSSSALAQFNQTFVDVVQRYLTKDMTRAVANLGFESEAECLAEHFKIAEVDGSNSGCLFSQIVVYTSFIVILIVIAARFVLALYFTYFVGWRLGDSKAYQRALDDLKRRREEFGRAGEARPEGLRTGPGARRRVVQSLAPSVADSTLSSRKTMFGSNASSSDSREAAKRRERERDLTEPSRRWSANFGFMDMEANTELNPEIQMMNDDPSLMHCLVMVPCYSEGYASLKATLNSVAHSYYPSTHKVLFVIADGIVKGKENDKSTPDILVDMIEVDPRFRNEDPRWGNEPPSYSYVAIADGVNRKNYAKVYAGWYKYDLAEGPNVGDKRKMKRLQRQATASSQNDEDDGSPAYLRTLRQRKEGRVPMLLIVKCGNDDEASSAKPGNRGKRDSQVILMNFLSKVIFDDRMTELEFDIFFKLFTITGVNPEKYEAVLMVDADTRIYPDSITHMVACLLKDDRIMGLCGETKISNKWDSWVTMIQVFEYFVSHHLSKAFESVFGGVTCLPGCFCMYRIKTPKGPNGYWVPILANPDIVEEYQENVVDTLHKKNLLLLGEDRFLTTMMLRAFPKRRMVFCPPAICKTVVPDTFKVLLSQRRRWINSTIHNLMELVLVKDLCGTFCISMQFVIFMELLGTLVLPAAITFTFTLLFLFIFKVGDTLLPLILLAVILGLPAVLIVVTANRVIYIFWMFIYLLSLPIWNFVLPMYAFWHFDDFSWGETRRVAGEVKGHDHSARDGEFDGTGINMKRWSEWVQVRKSEHLAQEEQFRGHGAHPGPRGVPAASIGRAMMNSIGSGSNGTISSTQSRRDSPSFGSNSTLGSGSTVGSQSPIFAASPSTVSGYGIGQPSTIARGPPTMIPGYPPGTVTGIGNPLTGASGLGRPPAMVPQMLLGMQGAPIPGQPYAGNSPPMMMYGTGPIAAIPPHLQQHHSFPQQPLSPNTAARRNGPLPPPPFSVPSPVPSDGGTQSGGSGSRSGRGTPVQLRPSRQDSPSEIPSYSLS
ncbi:chitin synthase-domain-containing protein [Zopfochytrium polystomum]|nr:chitin synthase-domain-containing protein [Zopfochytrium polystomum]